MTCENCEDHVTHTVNKLPGIVTVLASSKKGRVTVTFDTLKTNQSAITQAINTTGYEVSGVVTAK